jgi:WD40 repeat protein
LVFRYLVGCSNSDITVWSISSGKCVQKLKGHTARVTCIARNPHNQFQVRNRSFIASRKILRNISLTDVKINWLLFSISDLFMLPKWNSKKMGLH